MSAAAAATWLAGPNRSAGAATGLRMPAEWHPHARCVMAFSAMPFRAFFDRYTQDEVETVRREQVSIAQAISRFELVTMLVNRGDMREAREACGPGIDLVEMRHFDIWTRDTLPTISLDSQNRPVAVSWNFNVWGEKYAGYGPDRTLAKRFARHQGLPATRAGIVAEGGAFEVDGEGTLITTETCLLNRNRNPRTSREDVERDFRRLTGAEKILWLYGSDADTVTDGHVDALARFVRPGVIVAEVTDDTHDPEYESLRENLRRLEGQTDARERTLQVVPLKRPRWDKLDSPGDDFAASYVNSYLANGGLVMPAFGDVERDSAARETFRRLMPERQIVQLRLDQICRGGGGIHCGTQHIPAV